jgi:hypothetical protein
MCAFPHMTPRPEVTLLPNSGVRLETNDDGGWEAGHPKSRTQLAHILLSKRSSHADRHAIGWFRHMYDMTGYFFVPRSFLERSADLPPASVLLYLQLCARLATVQDGATTVSTAELARSAGLGRRTVFAALSHLENAGLISRAKPGTSLVSEYRILNGTESRGGDLGVEDKPEEPILQTPQAQSSSLDQVVPPQTQEIPERPLNDLIAAVYAPKCKGEDLAKYVDWDEADLRATLNWMRVNSRVNPEMTINFFVAVLRRARSTMARLGPAPSGNGHN